MIIPSVTPGSSLEQWCHSRAAERRACRIEYRPGESAVVRQTEPMVQPGPDPDSLPPIDPDEPVPDDPRELSPDTPQTLPPRRSNRFPALTIRATSPALNRSRSDRRLPRTDQPDQPLRSRSDSRQGAALSRQALQTGAGKAHDDAPTPLRQPRAGRFCRPIRFAPSSRRPPDCCATTSNNGSSIGRVELVSGRSVSVFVCLTLAGTFLTRAHSQMW